MAPPAPAQTAARWQRFADSYYALNALLVLAYLPLRAYFRLLTPDGSDYGKLHSLHEFATWEKQALGSYSVLVVWQFLRRRSWDHYAQGVFFYGKIMTALTVYQVDARLLVWYLLLCWVAIAVCPQPMVPLFNQTESDVVKALTPVLIKELGVLNAGRDTSWLVFLYSEQHAPSTAMASAFLELATEYTSPKLRFGAMDATLWPAYTRDSLRVSCSVWTAQLPAVVLLVKGKEAGRLPRVEDVDDLGLKKNHYTKGDVLRKLHLERYR